MKNLLLIFIFSLVAGNIFGQYDDEQYEYEYDPSKTYVRDEYGNLVLDTIQDKNGITVELDGKTHYTDYKIIGYNKDTTIVDTTLTMQKDYKFNFLRKDDFELMAFHNQGQTFNKLGYDFSAISYLPKMGMEAKHYSYREVEDIVYYNVPTPTSELMWRTGMKQGQVFDGFITMNTSPQLNLAIGYKGMRSLGKYRESLSSQGNFTGSFNYNTKNKRYYARGHFVAHTLINEENGGLTPEAVKLFESNDPEYTNRGRLDINFVDAESELNGKRYHYDHNFAFLKNNDTIIDGSNVKLGHTFNYETKHYFYRQTQSDLVGPSFDDNIFDNTGLRTMNNDLYIEFDSKYILGRLRAKTGFYNFNHYFQGNVYLNSGVVNREFKGNAQSIGAEWNAGIKNFNLNASASSIIAGDIEGYNFFGSADYTASELFTLKASISAVSKMPNFNFIHFQSDYIEYNWQNLNYKNEEIQNLAFDLTSTKILDASVSITNIKNYAYFDAVSKPQQANTQVNYLKVKAFKSFTVNHFSLDNTLMYQKVTQGTSVFRVPEFVTRNSLYYSASLFKNKPLYLQTGVTFKYFTEYKMNAYNPVLSEFQLQEDLYGEFPLFDLFINARVRRTRLFFKIENVFSRFTGRDYYSAPTYPYRDFNIRFGVVWDFFI